jgi:hypothetical protein
MRIVTRVTILVVMCWLPFALVTLASRRSEAGMVLVVPFFFTPPIALSAVAVFAPIERYLDGGGLGHLKNVGVPLLGAVAVALLALAWLVLLEKIEQSLGVKNAPNARTVSERIPGVIAQGGILGAVGGALWRLSEWVGTLLGLHGRA